MSTPLKPARPGKQETTMTTITTRTRLTALALAAAALTTPLTAAEAHGFASAARVVHRPAAAVQAPPRVAVQPPHLPVAHACAFSNCFPTLARTYFFHGICL